MVQDTISGGQGAWVCSRTSDRTEAGRDAMIGGRGGGRSATNGRVKAGQDGVRRATVKKGQCGTVGGRGQQRDMMGWDERWARTSKDQGDEWRCPRSVAGIVSHCRCRRRGLAVGRCDGHPPAPDCCGRRGQGAVRLRPRLSFPEKNPSLVWQTTRRLQLDCQAAAH